MVRYLEITHQSVSAKKKTWDWFSGNWQSNRILDKVNLIHAEWQFVKLRKL